MSERNLMDIIVNSSKAKDEKAKEETKQPEEVEENVSDDKKEAKAKEAPKEERVERHYVHSKNTIPDFLESAEKIPAYMQGLVAQHRRNMSSNSKLEEKDLLMAEGESVNVFKTNRGNLTMLKMRIEANNAPVYIPQNHAGASYRHLEDLIGQRRAIAIDQFVQTNEGEVDPEYILLGSIQQAEFVVMGTLFSAFDKDPEAVRKQVHEGVITQILERPAHYVEEDGKRIFVPDRSMVYFDYHGVSLGMREQDFYYRSQVKTLSQRAFIGEKIQFQITNIRKGDYRDSEVAQRDAKNGVDVPRGIRYYIDSTRLPLIPNPDDEIRKKLNDHTIFKAYIVRVDTGIKGILVEVAPRWWIKATLSPYSPVQPSPLDQAAHTPVTVRLDAIDFEHKSGRCTIIRFPKGVARAGISESM